MISVLLPPVVAIGTLFALMRVFGIKASPEYAVLHVLAFLVSLVVYREVAALATTYARRPLDFFQRSIGAWAIVVGCLAVVGFALQQSEFFSRRVLLSWGVVTPIAIAAFQYWTYVYFVQNPGRARNVVIAGVSDLSRRLAHAIASQPATGLALRGFFDDRDHKRLGPLDEQPLLGRLSDLPRYVKENGVDVIYIALPIRREDRTKLLLEELHDTTASIYFVPDIFAFDLIQSRVDVIDGIPALALCETPFMGVNGLIKRVTDLALATCILILALPLMLAIAAGVACTTQGSVIFKQRRYGLDGRKILVYKFRTMRTSDDGASVRQASRDDDRVTRFGRFLRRYSLDELPQLFNVIQGHMSLVGPRPHAIAHNEEYRRLIKGYMMRHKAPPGMTGLAQIRGLRGETKTLEQMRARVEADLEYLRQWSLALDLKIIALTIFKMFRDSKAY